MRFPMTWDDFLNAFTRITLLTDRTMSTSEK